MQINKSRKSKLVGLTKSVLSLFSLIKTKKIIFKSSKNLFQLLKHYSYYYNLLKSTLTIQHKYVIKDAMKN